MDNDVQVRLWGIENRIKDLEFALRIQKEMMADAYGSRKEYEALLKDVHDFKIDTFKRMDAIIAIYETDPAFYKKKYDQLKADYHIQ